MATGFSEVTLTTRQMPPQLMIHGNSNIPLPNFATDLDVLQAVYDEFMRLRVAGKKTKKDRAQAQSKIIDFDAFKFIQLTPFRDHRSNRLALHIGLSLTDTRYVYQTLEHLGGIDVYFRVFYDWTIMTGISAWRVYDGHPVVNPARQKWQKTVKWMNAARPYAWHWFEQYQKSSCSESGINKKRDLEAFKLDFIE